MNNSDNLFSNAKGGPQSTEDYPLMEELQPNPAIQQRSHAPPRTRSVIISILLCCIFVALGILLRLLGLPWYLAVEVPGLFLTICVIIRVSQQPTIQQSKINGITVTLFVVILLTGITQDVIYWLLDFAWYFKVIPIVIFALIFVWAGYTVWSAWTGFGKYKSPDDKDQGIQHAKNLWDWLQMSGVIAIPILAVLVPGWLSTLHSNDLQLVQMQHRNDLQIAQNQQQQAILETYLDRITDLILNNNLNDPKTNVEIRALMRARTLTTLLLLDPDRKATLIQFLYASRLIDTSGLIIDLRGADLRNVNLSHTYLEGVDLSGADLSGANLSLAFLNNANLSDTFLISANLSGTNLDNADLSDVDLFGAKVTNRQLAKAKSLKGAVLPEGSKHP